MPERIIHRAKEMSDLARSSVASIQSVTMMTRMLSLNALIEAGRAGEAGKGFAIVAKEVRGVSQKIDEIAVTLGERLIQQAADIDSVGKGLVATVRGTRLTDLALNMIEIIDRNLYERSCDVRWWATDATVVDLLSNPTPQGRDFASHRLGVILDNYTVYVDLWICDVKGNVIASGRPGKYPAVGSNFAGSHWFQQAMASRDGTEFAVDDVYACGTLSGKLVATYASAVRENGATNGRPVGVLGIHFDWQTQAQAVVDGVGLSTEEKLRTRCMILDARHRVIASSDHRGVLSEIFPINASDRARGKYADSSGNLVGYALTPGYETYRGLGWYGVLSQTPPLKADIKRAA